MDRVCGVGINDYQKFVKIKGKHLKSYNAWRNMLKRCYCEKDKKYKNYGAKGVKVCDEWLYFSNFKKWFDENYIEGYCLDKDIKGNGMLYSPETCIFVSKSDNTKEMLSRRDNSQFLGSKNGFSKPTNHYSKNPTTRGNFKRTCNHQGWNFNDFIEVETEFKQNYNKKYLYIKKED